jgi:hypothetical protein
MMTQGLRTDVTTYPEDMLIALSDLLIILGKFVADVNNLLDK